MGLVMASVGASAAGHLGQRFRSRKKIGSVSLSYCPHASEVLNAMRAFHEIRRLARERESNSGR